MEYSLYKLQIMVIINWANNFNHLKWELTDSNQSYSDITLQCSNTLNSSVLIMSSTICCFSSRRTVSIAMFVLPAPVGAQISKFSFELYAASKTTDWIRFNFLVPRKAVFPTCNMFKTSLELHNTTADTAKSLISIPSINETLKSRQPQISNIFTEISEAIRIIHYGTLFNKQITLFHHQVKPQLWQLSKTRNLS